MKMAIYIGRILNGHHKHILKSTARFKLSMLKEVFRLGIFLTLVFEFVTTVVDASITTSDYHGNGFAVSLLELPKSSAEHQMFENQQNMEDFMNTGDAVSDIPNTNVSFDGFNLLYLIASKVKAKESSPIEDGVETSEEEIQLDTTKARQNLRFSRKILRGSLMYSDASTYVIPPVILTHIKEEEERLLANTSYYEKNSHMETNDDLDLNNFDRIIVGNYIGFELYFKVEEDSGSGYLITGRSLDQAVTPSIPPRTSSRAANKSSAYDPSWFGIYVHARRSSYTLQLEYRNIGWTKRSRFEIRMAENFRKSEWQKLSLHINFRDNLIDYWVNCSSRPTIQVNRSGMKPTIRYGTFRILQKRGRRTLPVKVNFRTAIVTSGERKMLPQQCFSSRNESSNLECQNGMVYMACGPTCQKTCKRGVRSTPAPDIDDELQSCALACVSGCHCPAGMVTHRGFCISPRRCPCIIGLKEYPTGTKHTINNEVWFTVIPRGKDIRAGKNLTLTCGVVGNPLPRIMWTTPEEVKHKITSLKGGRLSVLSVANISVTDEGTFVCQGSSDTVNWNVKKIAQINVLAPPVIDIPRGITVAIGEPVLSIDCKVTGHPTPVTKWSRRNYNFAENTKSIYTGNVQRLKITNVNRRNSGEYECRAWNRAGQDVKSIRVIVELSGPYRMAFERRPVNQYVKRGHTAIFNCKMIDHLNNAVNVTWFKDGKRLQIDGKKIIQRTTSILIRQVRTRDAGTYSCVIGRLIGEPMAAKADLMIKGQLLPWSQWSRCTVTCGRGGIMFKRRLCTGVPPNKRTCRGNLISTRPCNRQVCPGHCTVIGAQHLETFDGSPHRFYDTSGSCLYVLAEDAISNRFRARISSCATGNHVRCLSTVTAIVSLPNCSMVVDFNQNNIVKVNKISVPLPHVDATCPYFIDKIGNYLTLSVQDSFEIRWATPHRLYIIMDGRYHKKVRGLCGNFDFIKNNDKETLGGEQLDSDHLFEINWMRMDKLAPEKNRQCDLGTKRQAHASCNLMQYKAFTGKCQSKVGVIRHIGNCVADICRTSITNTNLFYCLEFEDYSDRCLRENVALQWRGPGNCEASCGPNQRYLECGPTCTHYCPGVVNIEGQLCVSSGRCVAGCHCNPDLVLHNGKCIPANHCPCTFGSQHYRNGSMHKRNCEKCTCIDGQWNCTYNSQLCDFAAAVLKGPTSEIISNGDNISICCEAIGLPTPAIQWFHNNRPYIETTKYDSVFGRSRSMLQITNATDRDAGTYSCKAINKLGSHFSEHNLLSIIASPWVVTCKRTPMQWSVSLPDGCYVAGPHRSNLLNIGRCSSLPCYSQATSKNRSQCNKARSCCQPSITSPVKVNCHHPLYQTSFIVTVVRACECSVCEKRATVVEGVLKLAYSSNPIKHAKIIYLNRVVAYTSDTGSFHVAFNSLPPDTRFVTLKFVDVYIKGFAAVVKNLPVLVGDVTIHTVLVHGRSTRIRFNATTGFSQTIRSLSKEPIRYRLRLPACAFYSDILAREYRGNGLAVVTLLDGFTNPNQAKSIPGSFVAIDASANKKMLSPKVVLSVSFFDGSGKSMHLKPNVNAEFLVISYSLKQNLLPWELDHVTGYWRKQNARVGVKLVNKRGRRIIVFTSKIPRFTTSWAFGRIQDPCFVRAAAFNGHNESISGIRVSLSASEQAIASRKTKHTYTYSEDITRTQTTSALCLPMICGHFGTLSASKQGNELAFLVPDIPTPDMGTLSNHAEDKIDIENMQEIPLMDSASDDLSFIPSQAYFRSEAECREMAPLTHSRYVFREDSTSSSIVGNVIRSEQTNRVIQTFVINDPEQMRAAKAQRIHSAICHLKVAVIIQASVATRGIFDETMTLEAITFRAKSLSKLSIIGWRRTSFSSSGATSKRKTVSIITRRARYTTQPASQVRQDVCVEYLCSGGRGEDVVYITAKPSEKRMDSDVKQINCSFVSYSQYDGGSSSEESSGDGEWGSRRTLSNGGYVFFQSSARHRQKVSLKRRNVVNRSGFNAPHSSRYGYTFIGRSITESQNFCSTSSGNDVISAWITCS